ncbi:hypothetical protein TNCV_3269151 [Trichonephila clavipes]|nr:hypothetical protein TNCV_3269151 [Trichonephila clavipes]
MKRNTPELPPISPYHDKSYSSYRFSPSTGLIFSGIRTRAYRNNASLEFMSIWSTLDDQATSSVCCVRSLTRTLMTESRKLFLTSPEAAGADNLVALHFKYDQARRRFVEWVQNEIAIVSDFHKRILFSDETHFWLNGYVNKQNCRIWSEANPQVYVETPLHPEKLTVWCALWAGGILLQKR